MAVRIASNGSSLTAQRWLSSATSDLSKVSEQLSSGLRINHAADDAAGLQIAEQLHGDSRVYSQAVRNVNDGISLLDIAQGAVEQLSSIVTRQAELAEQASNGVYSNKQRIAMNAEATALTKEFNRIVSTTSFNGVNTLTGNTNSLRLQFGYGTNGGIAIGIGSKLGFAAGSGSFQARGSYSTWDSLTGNKVGDFNGDNILDMVAADSSGIMAGINLMIGNGDGTFRAAVSFFTDGDSTFAVQVGDYNNDGILDVASTGADLVALGNDAFRTTLFFGNGDGSFTGSRSYILTGFSIDLQSADFNGDGILDLAATDADGGMVDVLLGNQDGSFKAYREYLVGYYPQNGLRIGDLNGDGKIDIVAADTSGTVSILIANGDGSFRAAATYENGGAPYDCEVGDINGDGILDIITPNGGDQTISVFYGNGNGTFRARVTLDNPGSDSTIALKDMNGDNNLDLIFGGNVYLGNGNGTFRAGLSFVAGGGTVGPIADYNGDGIPDIGYNGGIYIGTADSTGRRNNRLEDIDLSSRYTAKVALNVTRATLTRINQELGNIGASQSRLTAAGASLLVSRENFDAAKSQLLDADVAEKSGMLAKTKILQQAATAVLAQANQQPQLALNLLSGLR